jgi:HSP20 family protein
MTLIRRKPVYNAFPALFDDAFFKDFFEPQSKGLAVNSKTIPAVNILEAENAFNIEVAAPGLEKENFSITVDEDVLTISSEVKNESEETDKKGKFTKREFSYQSFKRSFTLDEDSVDTEKITASYEKGVLHVNIPKKVKTEEVKVAKTISVN